MNAIRLALRELGNKVAAYRTVNAAGRIGGASRMSMPLQERLRAVESTGPYSALWAVESVGLHYADRCWNGVGEPEPWLLSEAAAVEERHLPMLHAGLGLSLTRRVLSGLPPRVDDATLEAAFERLIVHLHDGSLPRYEAFALEAVGAVTRLFFPALAPAFWRRSVHSGLFWHGAGRAHYFLPSSFVPGRGGVRRACARIASEAPDTEARRSAQGGLAAAITLVNQRQPELVVDRLLAARRCGAAAESLRYGLAAAAAVRRAATPEDRTIDVLLRYVSSHGGAGEHAMGYPSQGHAEPPFFTAGRLLMAAVADRDPT